ncbi:hypothetical protein V144x_56250 [Gimesia aquarii]|uniref:Uncharacterized protein n=1 Tax=Gimesia aquarii TaxID=2527964 RepID=A0A517W4C9_9PLAN|nr:hypothetical protein V144x_56250 [Gimesia aquarii]
MIRMFLKQDLQRFITFILGTPASILARFLISIQKPIIALKYLKFIGLQFPVADRIKTQKPPLVGL